MEDILNEIILISEIAELSVESETIANVMGLKREDFDVEPPREIKTAREARASRMPKVRWSSLKFDGDVGSWGMVDDEDNDDDDDVDGEPDDAEDGRIAKEGRTYESSSRLPIKDLLDKWEEPLSKRDQVNSANFFFVVGMSSQFLGWTSYSIDCMGSLCWYSVAQHHCQRYLKVSKSTHLHGSGLSILGSFRSSIHSG